MDSEVTRSNSLRTVRRIERGSESQKIRDADYSPAFSQRSSQDSPLKFVSRRSFLRFSLVVLILISLLIIIWSCQAAVFVSSGHCRRDSKMFGLLDTMGLLPKPMHRCPIPLANDPEAIVIPKHSTPKTLPQKLSYILEDESFNGDPLFGGRQTWEERDESFKLNTTMRVHCGFMKHGGAEMEAMDVKYVKKCKFVVASGIFDGYDTPHQPSNISTRSKKLFCFLMVVDEISFTNITKTDAVTEDSDGGKWVGIWRLIVLHEPPYDEPRRNGKVPKILTHRLFPQAQYSIWIDGKMELIVDPLLILERYLWRGRNTFAISQHKHHRSIYEEADANKRRKRYARPLIDLHMKIYVYEGMEAWSPKKRTPSDVPEGAIIIREHTPMTNLFSCLWFNEAHKRAFFQGRMGEKCNGTREKLKNERKQGRVGALDSISWGFSLSGNPPCSSHKRVKN
ncbi:uncharacterized protein LOC18447506 isoform X2 [Amborella trichopoda]|uniref:uncharacterized protein LOC18447506 isoform X2 n=1 Tax=Amborella trichopoda TaxID=13333 RepID=UPI0009BE3D27|nr:uncharacterized protein LOC18447506 isoform X2 [Amborella trichopoda]|eukprot:XP_020531206.1 uncharacterized protein LOC18447506 isoform X2 [Amborella trichopoda]